MRITCKIISIVSILVFLSGCNQRELDKLKTENQELKNRVATLEQENTKLKETDQYYFNKGIDSLGAASTKDDYQKTIDVFNQLTEKFPLSTYKPKALEYLGIAQKKLANIEKIEKGRGIIESSINELKFDTATNELQKIKTLISQDEFNSYKTLIYEEKNKPLETTINKIISEYGSKNRNWDASLFKMIGLRVKVLGNFSSIDRDRMMISAYSDGPVQGSRIEVNYESSNMKESFTNNDPSSSQRYAITGKIKMYSNSGDIYIDAEKIEPY